jgi:glycosyltransferase involved in cell wall biosynthesis
MKNIHINMNEFINASRVLKQTNTLIENDVFEQVSIVALGTKGLPEFEQISDRVSLYRINLISRKLPKNLFFQALKYIEFLFRVLFLISKMQSKVVNVHALSLLPIGLISKVFFKSFLIYDTHELETERNGLHGIRKIISKFTEKKIIKYVDMTIVVSESIADWYKNEYNIHRPPVVLNAPNHRKLKVNNHFREQLGIRVDQIILLYQGGLVSGRGVDLILDAFKLRTNDDLVVVFMGYGELEKTIKTASEQHDNIYFFPAVRPEVVLEYTASADVGISLIENTCLSYYYCMPNKLFEYAMAGLPILVSDMKDMSELVTRQQMGAVICPPSAIGINKAVDNLLINDLTQMKKNAYRVANENAWSIQEMKMLNAYKEMFKRDGK